VIAISDAVGNPVVRRGYGVYGETDPAQMVGTTSAGTSPHPFGYTGRRWDPDLGLYYFRARWYDPTLGTFLQTDPIGSLDYVNLYSYVGLEPGNATDPTGMCGPCVFIVPAVAPEAVPAAAATIALAFGIVSKVIIDNVLGDAGPLLFPEAPQGPTKSESRGRNRGGQGQGERRLTGSRQGTDNPDKKVNQGQGIRVDPHSGRKIKLPPPPPPPMEEPERVPKRRPPRT
jgi:RHS repeat-associated protein